MADKKTETKTAAEPAAPDVDTDAPRQDETIPGGHYITSDGVHVDAEGNELTKTGKPKAKPEE